ncbi:hypothetical protein [Mesorhizobium sp.]|uniref:hypothetical protein n=1 Tax=Mesorhizobium sp. TaxID=1871066 RepID=UPI00257BDFAB|nr:hypothetical protein [Mesorhizobium sp.]
MSGEKVVGVTAASASTRAPVLISLQPFGMHLRARSRGRLDGVIWPTISIAGFFCADEPVAATNIPLGRINLDRTNQLQSARKFNPQNCQKHAEGGWRRARGPAATCSVSPTQIAGWSEASMTIVFAFGNAVERAPMGVSYDVF